jgi:hypothetical protein
MGNLLQCSPEWTLTRAFYRSDCLSMTAEEQRIQHPSPSKQGEKSPSSKHGQQGLFSCSPPQFQEQQIPHQVSAGPIIEPHPRSSTRDQTFSHSLLCLLACSPLCRDLFQFCPQWTLTRVLRDLTASPQQQESIRTSISPSKQGLSPS